MVWLSAGCGNKGKSAHPPTSVSVVAGDGSAVVTFAAEPGVQYWLFYAPSSELNETNFNTLAGGKLIVDAVSPQRVAGLQNGTTYYFTINGRTDHGPGGTGTSLVSATPRSAGGSWNPGQLQSTANLRGAAYGAAFVVAGAGGAMFSTPDGASWTAINYVVSTDLNAAFFGIGRYIVVGDSGVILSSTDAATWTQANSGTSAHLYAGTSDGISYAAVGANGVFLKSNDGQTWTVGNAGTTRDLAGIAYGLGRWVAVGAGGTIVTGTDSSAWQAAASPTTSDLKAITFAPAKALFVAVGAGGTVVTSPDGVNWTARGSIAQTALAGVAYGSQFATVGDGGAVFTSADAITWQPVASGSTSDIKTIVFGNYRFLAAGSGGATLYAK